MELGKLLFGLVVLAIGYFVMFRIPSSFFEGYRDWVTKQVGVFTLNALGAALFAGGFLLSQLLRPDTVVNFWTVVGISAIALIGLIVVISSVWYWRTVYHRD